MNHTIDRLLLSLIIALSFSTVFSAQETSEQVQEDQFDALEEFKHLPLQDIEKDFVKENFEEKLFTKIQHYIAEVKFELKGYYETLRYHQVKVLDRKMREAEGNSIRIPRTISTNYYNKLTSFSVIRSHHFLNRSIKKLLQIEDLFNYSYESLYHAINREKLMNAAYDIQSLLGILYLYRGVPYSIEKSIDRFNFLMGVNPFNYNFVEGNVKREKTIYEYLISIHGHLYNYYRNQNTGQASIHRLKRLEYEWELLKRNYADKPNVLAVKQIRLLSYEDLPEQKLMSTSVLYEEFVDRFDEISGLPPIDQETQQQPQQPKQPQNPQ